MRYGTYLAAPRVLRIVVHLSGMAGSPLAAWWVGRLTQLQLPIGSAVCIAAFWVLAAFNAALFLGALVGLRHFGPLRLAISSGGVAGQELREGLQRRRTR
jgi:hypothetical protein